jgi:DNA mismatch endonuclease (patch repair protein)
MPRNVSGKDGRPRTAVRSPRNSSVSDSWASTPNVRSQMQAQRTRDTAPEMAVRRLLHAMGLRYRVDRSPLPGLRRRADIVFGPAQVAVYIDGCFWHCCPRHGTRPISNASWWENKLAGNRARDADTDQHLRDADWISIRIWEHEDPKVAAEEIRRIVQGRLGASSGS